MVKRRRLLGLLIATLLTGAVPPAASRDLCPAEQGCKVAEGRYRLIVPPAYSEGAALGAIIFFHGYQGSAEETASDPALLAAAARLGVALVAPDGQGRTWSYPGSPGRYRDEFAFVAHVLDDVSARFPVDPKRIMASGFSQGGSMVWYLACLMPERFRAFAPTAADPCPWAGGRDRPACRPQATQRLRAGRHIRKLRDLGPGRETHSTQHRGQRRQGSFLPFTDRQSAGAGPRTLPACRRSRHRSSLDRAGLATHDGGSRFREAVTNVGRDPISSVEQRAEWRHGRRSQTDA